MDRFTGQHLIVAAGGSGLAPVRPILNHFFNAPDQVLSLHLLAGFRNPAGLLFRRDLDRWRTKFKITLTVDKGDDGWDGNVGLITECVKRLDLADLARTQVVIVGPPPMMKFTAAEFILKQVPPRNIWVSFERLMSCGLGKCGHCKIDYTYVCLDGPVLNFSQAREMID